MRPRGEAPRGPRGRGALTNPKNRFEPFTFEREPASEDEPGLATEFFHDQARSLITYNESPDVGFDASINVYRGCEHGCVYCFARPNHEFLGLSAGLDFESRIFVKAAAPELLKEELGRAGWKPQTIALSGVTDPYQPVERHTGLTRQCLEVLAAHRNPVVIITKNDLVTRDADLLASMSQWNGAAVYLSITTLDAGLANRLEPRAVTPKRRLAAIRALADAGVPLGVLAAPMIPGLTEHELPAILQAAADAGARYAGYVPLRLPYGVGQLFDEWLTEHLPDRKAKIVGRIRSMRGGAMNDPAFVSRMQGEGPYAREMRDLFDLGCRRSGLASSRPVLSSAGFRVDANQLNLFE